ncbi:MAG: DUF1192 domain-containing protein [Hyphomicrobiales bacterium]|nr:DUF1192 domain-containing protein [Hyphomicrobiales bacterium]
MWDDGEAKKLLKPIQIGEELERLSIAELEERVKALLAEISRVQQKISQKQASASAASAVFKK